MPRLAAPLLAGLLIAAPVLAPSAAAGDAPTQDCNIETPYALRVDAAGIRLDGDDARPRRVEIRDGALWLDGVRREVGAEDAARLRAMEAQARGLLPEVEAIARESVHIAFDALEHTARALSGERQAREFRDLRERALVRVDESLGRGTWDPDAFGESFEAEIEAAAESMAASITPARALWMAFTGGAGRLERRMEKMEARLERDIAAREGTLETHARALCGRLRTLDALQRSLEVRLDDGTPLRLFEIDPPRIADAGTAAR